jgi:16S rRNA (guanine527-N7)-methyltransferase
VTSQELSDLVASARGVGASVDAATAARLEIFVDLLVVWNRRLRLTGDRDRRVLLRKHVVDSLAVAPELPASGLIVDLGSGAGFPGIVLGCARPDLAVRLIEPRRRPVSFLAEAIRNIPLPGAQALEMGGEEAASSPSVAGRSRLVVSRALRLDVFLGLALPLLGPDGLVVAMQAPSLGEAHARDQSRPMGLDLVRLRDYQLPDGEARRLFIFGRR